MAAIPKPEFTLRTDIYPAIDPGLFEGSLDGKVALITGSGRGIGREIALALAKSGAAVAISGRTRSEVDCTTEEVASKSSRKAIGVVADVCVKADLDRLVKEVYFAESQGPERPTRTEHANINDTTSSGYYSLGHYRHPHL